MKKLLVAGLILFAIATTATAQRIYGLSDSTTHVISATETVVAGRHRLYRLQQGQLQSFANFYTPADTNLFIRDFDFWDNQHFYVVLGSRYIGFPTQNLRTFNGGITWEVDTALLAASDYPVPGTSLNGMQTYGDSTMYAFDGYYESAVLVSPNRGRTWYTWFFGQIAHWFQFMICDNGRHYLMSTGGDAFGGHLYLLPDWLFGQDSVIHTIPFANRLFLVSSSIRYVEPYFLPLRDSLCAVPLYFSENPASVTPLTCYPNPTDGTFLLELPATVGPDRSLEVFDATGRLVYSRKKPPPQETYNLSHLGKGLFCLRVISREQVFLQKLVIR